MGASSRSLYLDLHSWSNINDAETKDLIATDVVEDERMANLGNSEPSCFIVCRLDSVQLIDKSFNNGSI